jgi:CRP-like cAMP-binding protein
MKGPNPTIARLRDVPALRSQSDRQLADLARQVDELVVPAGTVLMREGRVGQEAFIVLDGEVAVSVGDRRVATLGAGAIVGEMSPIDHQPRSATVITTTSARLITIGPAAMGSFMLMPGVSRHLVTTLAARLRGAQVQATG